MAPAALDSGRRRRGPCGHCKGLVGGFPSACDGLRRALDSLQRSPTVGSGTRRSGTALAPMAAAVSALQPVPDRHHTDPQTHSLDRSTPATSAYGIWGWRKAPAAPSTARSGPARRARARVAPAFDDRDQRLVLSLQLPSSWAAGSTRRGRLHFSVKGPRFITHMKKLREIEAPIANFFASGVLRLGRKLGPVLWQFPPNFAFDPATFEPFLATLPFDTDQALRIAERHDHRVAGRTWLEIDAVRRIRHAVEVRHRASSIPTSSRCCAVRRRVRRRRHDGLWPRTTHQRRLRLRPAARLADALPERVQRGRARLLGGAHRGLANRRAGRGCTPDRVAPTLAMPSARRLLLLRQHRQAAGADRREAADRASAREHRASR